MLNTRTGLVLIDCITVWIGNLMHHGRDVNAEIKRLCEALARARARVIVVSNEVGLGIVPGNALARAFRDEQGFANQRIAEVADEVIFVTAGLPIVLKKRRRKPATKAKAASSRGRKA
jgi:adenosylcobinamide kinase/adenosylcobinamide-phosphate guanylyltransferase